MSLCPDLEQDLHGRQRIWSFNGSKERKRKMLEKIQELVAEGLGVEKEEVVESASFTKDLGADSLDLFELVMSLEEEFGVKIPTEDLEKIDTVGDVMEYITAHKE